MTALNHMATGAIIAVTIKVSLVAIPLALLSHYVCDIIPHFGIYEHDRVKRNGHWLFKLITILNLIGIPVLFILIPTHTEVMVSWLTLSACMLAAIFPDIVWVPLYVSEVRHKQEKPLGKFNQLHQTIQWYEQPLGLTVEVVWFLAAMFVLFFVIR